MYKEIMGNGGVICKLIGSGNCDKCKAKDIKLKILPYKGINKRIYKILIRI